MTKINLPDRLVVMANHQAYTDWMYLWILACYSGHSTGVIILLKEGLKKIPVVGWGMVSLLIHVPIFQPSRVAPSRESLKENHGGLQDRPSMSGWSCEA